MQYLRPDQIEEMRDEQRLLRSILDAPPYIASSVDRREVARQEQRLRKQLETQTPPKISERDLDGAIRTEQKLREEILEGMPTQAEMRRNPPGAVDKHQRWEDRNKQKIMKWKNLRRQLHFHGHIDAGDVDHANLEVYRPVGGSGEMNMDNAQIPGKDIYLPKADAGLPAVFSDDDVEKLKAIDAEIADSLATLDNTQRQMVKDFLKDVASKQEKPKSRISELRAKAKEVGINSFGKSAEQLEKEISEAE